MKTALACFAVIAFLGSGAVLAQYRAEPPGGGAYRSGEAAVMQQRAAEAPSFNEPVKAFGEHYRSAGQPRIALFWNIALADRLADEKVKQSTTAANAAKSGNSRDIASGPKDTQSHTRDGDERTSTQSTTTQREFEIDRTRRQMSQMTESDAWRIEAGFSSRMGEAGVRFVDRAAILRIMQSKDGGDGNVRLVEAKALSAMADLLLEVLATRDAQAPSGYGFRVTLRDLKTGQQKAAFYSQAAPEVLAPERRYVAGPSGYEPVAAPTVPVDEVGAALALDAMRELVGRLR